MLGRTYGATSADSGQASAGNRLRFTNGHAVTAMKASIWVDSSTATGCAANTSPTTAKARLSGLFFNTATPIPGSCVNDVAVAVYIERSSEVAGLKVKAKLYHCGDANCEASEELASEDLGAAQVKTKVTLLLQWDQANHRFIVQRDAKPPVYLPYSVSDTASPGCFNNKRLDVNYYVANCTSEPRPIGYMDAYFDGLKRMSGKRLSRDRR